MRQYENFPYPEVSEKHIAAEEAYYKNNDEIPSLTIPAITLENVNHYLHRGNENFR